MIGGVTVDILRILFFSLSIWCLYMWLIGVGDRKRDETIEKNKELYPDLDLLENARDLDYKIRDFFRNLFM